MMKHIPDGNRQHFPCPIGTSYLARACLWSLLAAGAGPAAANPLSILYQGTSADAVNEGPGQGLYQPLPVAGGAVIFEEQGPSNGAQQIIQLTPAGRNQPYTRTVIAALPVGDNSFSGILSPDKSGNLWGIALLAGNVDNLFELVKPAVPGGTWVFNTILTMPAALETYGSGSYGPLIFDHDGNIYGVVQQFVNNVGCGSSGCGNIFKIPAALLTGGAGMVKLLFTFPASAGLTPRAYIVRDAHGNFFGASVPANGYGAGLVWEVSPPVSGSHRWSYTTLHSFCTDQSCPEGVDPQPPALGANGVLYGTSNAGGGIGCFYSGQGTVWSLTPPGTAGAAWGLTVLHTFQWDQGTQPYCTPTSDFGVGNPFGPTLLTKAGQLVFAVGEGGAGISGGVVSVDAATGADAILNNAFAATGTGGQSGPYVQQWAITQDGAGNVYGTTAEYYDDTTGVSEFPGVIYKIGK